MTASANEWFVRQYVSGAKHVIQASGWHTKGLASGPSNQKGNIVQFKVAGRGDATEMSEAVEDRPVLNADRSTVEATMKDYEANEWIKVTDLEKMTESEIQVAQQTCGMAMGRKYDKVLFDAMSAGSALDTLGDGSAAPSLAVLLQAQRDLRAQGIMGAKRMVAAVPYNWMALWMVYDQFNSSDYIGDHPLVRALGAKTWMGMDVIPFPDEYFSVPGANRKTGLVWMPDCVGFHTNYDLVSRVDYVPQKKAHFAGNTMGMCAQTILAEGVIKLDYLDNTDPVFA